MHRWMVRMLIPLVGVVGLAGSASAQEPGAQAKAEPVAVELGWVMGIIAQPYFSAGVVTGPWAFRVSGTPFSANGHGVQFNAGRIVRDSGNAKHTLSLMWAHFGGSDWMRPNHGEFAGVMYTFQVKGFFVEAGPGWGSKNPFDIGLGHVYGQLGYVHRFGKKYEDDDDDQSAKANWTRVRHLTPGASLTVTTKDQSDAPRRFVAADDSGIVVLNATAISAEDAFLLMGPVLKQPADVAAVVKGATFTSGTLRMSPAGIFDGDRRIAGPGQGLEHIARDAVIVIYGADARQVVYVR